MRRTDPRITLAAYIGICVYGIVSGKYFITILMGFYLLVFAGIPFICLWFEERKKPIMKKQDLDVNVQRLENTKSLLNHVCEELQNIGNECGDANLKRRVLQQKETIDSLLTGLKSVGAFLEGQAVNCKD